MPRFKFTTSDNLTLVGWSVAARRTSLWIPELRMGLDAGGIDPEDGVEPPPLRIVLGTHGHRDHMKEIHNIALEPTMRTKIFFPKNHIHYLDNFITSSHILNKGNLMTSETELEKCFEIIGVSPREKVYISSLKLELEIFHCYHYPTTVGYGVSEVRKCSRTDEEISQLIANKILESTSDEDKEILLNIKNSFDNNIKPDGKMYKYMRDNNIDFSILKRVPLFAFLCDTTHRVFEDKNIFKYPTIIVECTFYENTKEQLKEAKDKNHTHFYHLIDIIKNNPNNYFRLIHHSARYNAENIYQEELVKKHYFETINEEVNYNFVPNFSIHI